MASLSKAIQPVGWMLNGQLPSVLRYVQALRLPPSIYQSLSRLENVYSKIPPFSSLHDAIAAFSQDVISFSPDILKSDMDNPRWLYAMPNTRIDPDRVRRLIQAWLIACYGEQRAESVIKGWGRLDWSWDTIDLATADDKLKRMLLPGLAVRWLLRDHYSLTLESASADVSRPMRLAPLMTSRYTAELISEPITNDESSFSTVIFFWLETMPGTGELCLLHKAGTRRWLTRSLISPTGNVYLKFGRSKSVYLRRGTGYIDNILGEDVFARITMKLLGKGVENLRWVGNQARVFEQLGLRGAPPLINQLAVEPGAFLSTALVTMENKDIHKSDAGAGLPSGDHRHIFDDLNKHLMTIMEPMPIWIRAREGDARRNHHVSRKTATPEVRRAALLAMPYSRIELHVDKPWQVKKLLLEAIGVYEEYRERIKENPLCITQDGRECLEIVEMNDREMTRPFPENTPAWGIGKANAESQRQKDIKEHYDKVQQPTGALILLPNYKAMKQEGRDPKQSIRAGLLSTGRVTQFYTPKDDGQTNEAFSLRIRMAVADLLRTLGYRYKPFYMKPSHLNLPAELDLMSFWLIRLNSRHRDEQTITLPLMVYVPFGVQHLHLLLPRASGGAELHLSLREGIAAATESTPEYAEPSDTLNFFRDALEMIKRQSKRDALLLISDQNVRRVFSELTEQKGGAYVRLNNLLTDMPHIRVARLRFSGDNEAPFCLPRDKMGKYQGLYGHDDYPNLFYSLWTLGERHASAKWHKLDDSRNAAANPSTVQIWMNNLQEGDRADDWAALVHQLRRASSHTDIPTSLPQPLHDIEIVSKYLSRFDDEQPEDELNELGIHSEEG